MRSAASPVEGTNPPQLLKQGRSGTTGGPTTNIALQTPSINNLCPHFESVNTCECDTPNLSTFPIIFALLPHRDVYQCFQ